MWVLPSVRTVFVSQESGVVNQKSIGCLFHSSVVCEVAPATCWIGFHHVRMNGRILSPPLEDNYTIFFSFTFFVILIKNSFVVSVRLGSGGMCSVFLRSPGFFRLWLDCFLLKIRFSFSDSKLFPTLVEKLRWKSNVSPRLIDQASLLSVNLLLECVSLLSRCLSRQNLQLEAFRHTLMPVRNFAWEVLHSERFNSLVKSYGEKLTQLRCIGCKYACKCD